MMTDPPVEVSNQLTVIVVSVELTSIGATFIIGTVAGMKVLLIENAPVPAYVTPRTRYCTSNAELNRSSEY